MKSYWCEEGNHSWEGEGDVLTIYCKNMPVGEK